MSQTLSDLPPQLVQRLTDAVKLLAEVHSRKLSDAAIRVWCKALAPYAEGSALWRSLAQGCEEERMPSLHRLKELMRGRPETSEFKPLPRLAEAEQKRADHSAILSMLWLHYAKNWQLNDFAGHALGRLFGRDPADALRAAKMHYDRDTVLRWMDDQIRIGH